MSDEKMFCPNCGSECEKTEKFCGSCGAIVNETKEEKLTDNKKKYYIRKGKTDITPTILIQSGYILGTIATTIILCFGIYFLALSIFSGSNDVVDIMNIYSNDDGNAFQQIYNLVHLDVKTSISIGIILGITLCITASLIFDFALSAFAKFNSIQEQINETQELIHKHFDVMNERFNKLENKE